VKDDLVLLQHIRDCILRIEEYTAGGEEEFYASTLTQDAVIRNFEVIGEATKGLTTGTTQAYPEIPWRNIAGMRDYLIHVYFGVKLELVWQTIQTDLPPLKSAVLAAIAGKSQP
jgi:uncharacterized protein with HEPN domain